MAASGRASAMAKQRWDWKEEAREESEGKARRGRCEKRKKEKNQYLKKGQSHC